MYINQVCDHKIFSARTTFDILCPTSCSVLEEVSRNRLIEKGGTRDLESQTGFLLQFEVLEQVMDLIIFGNALLKSHGRSLCGYFVV